MPNLYAPVSRYVRRNLVAAVLLATTEAIVAEQPKEDEGGGMPDMGGMM